MGYEFRTQPFDHQRRVWEETRDLAAYAIFWEQGTGKTKLSIDTIGHLWHRGEITGVIVVAPNGVHRNWITDELPAHLPEDIPLHSHTYEGERADAKWHQEACKRLLSVPGLALLAISYDSWMTKRGKKLVWDFMRKRRCMLILDESARIKTPSARRTRSILAGSRYAPYRRVLSGTPIAQGPFDVYTQVQAIDPDFWERELGISTFTAFKAYFGVWDKGYNREQGREFDILVGYQNLPELEAALKRISSRVTKEEVLDLPPKLYSKRYYEMTPAQRRVYDDLEREFMTWLDSGELVTAPLAITRMLRLQQVLCGYLPVEGEDEPRDLIEPGGRNPRLALLREVMEDIPGKTIIWGVYNRDIDLIMEMLRRDGRNPVQYDGRVSDGQRAANKEAFQNGDATDFVAKASTAGEGLTLTAARTCVYYNNSYRLIERKQSEDRPHRIGQEFPVNYIDLVCPGTRDEDAIAALVAKHEVASIILGDKIRSWL